jgi:hypothetical protein
MKYVVTRRTHVWITGIRIPDPPFSSFGPTRDYGMQGRIQGGGGGPHPARASPKIGKNMIFLA